VSSSPVHSKRLEAIIMDQSYPLTQQHKDALLNVCQSCRQHADVAKRAVAAGLPFQKHVDALEQQHAIATNLLQQFYPES
jgi:hypothetical protein